MKKSSSDLVSEIKHLLGQYQNEVGNGGYKVWPKSIRDRIFELCEVLGSSTEAADLCGISVHTIYKWRYDEKQKSFKSLPVVQVSKKPITVTVPKTKTSDAKSEVVTVTVTTPRGFKIQGLNLRGVLDMIRELETGL